VAGAERIDMKCQKCGFVSFDYLSQCKKCGADLTAVRELLGFSALKSEVPFLLSALLQSGGKGSGGKETSDVEAGSLNLNSNSGLHWPEAPGSEQVPQKPSDASDRKLAPGKTSKDELVIELSEDDLEALAELEKK
jgi:hypothetical protein